MIAYKLIRKLKDGSLSPLFINKKSRIPINEWLTAESHPTKGFAYRVGWHCTLKPIAPHLSTNNRVWVQVEIEDFQYYNRPESQGGTWVLAQKMRVIRELNEMDLKNVKRNRYYGIRVGDIVKPNGLHGKEWEKSEVIEYGFMDNNEVYIRATDGTETKWVAEWCDIITNVEDKKILQ